MTKVVMAIPPKEGKKPVKATPKPKSAIDRPARRCSRDNQHDIDRCERQKAGDFTDRLNQADMKAFQVDRLDGIVVEQNRIGLQSRHGSGSEDGKESEHWLINGGEHCSPSNWLHGQLPDDHYVCRR